MRLSTAGVLGFAIVAGGLATMMARSILVNQAAPVAGVKLVVAAKPLRFGMPLTRENIQEIDWGSAIVPEGAFTSFEALSKDGARVVLTPFGRNEPIIASRVSGPGQKASLAAMLEPGMRAVTVRVDDVKGVAGFIMPGDRVDIVLTRSDEGQSFSDVLLQNVKVLAIDQLANERQESAKIARAVTLEVTMEQGQKLVLAGGAGALSLILRQSDTAEPQTARRITLVDLTQGDTAPQPSNKIDEAPKAESPAPQPAEAMPAKTVKVQIIRGSKPDEVEVDHEVRRSR